jgi:hypothetical protein
MMDTRKAAMGQREEANTMAVEGSVGIMVVVEC